MTQGDPVGPPAATPAAPTAGAAGAAAGRPDPARAAAAARARGALTRYRVMAWVTGTMLLVLCLEMVLKYVFQVNGVGADGEINPVIGAWVPFVHGWIYVVYLVTVANLWSSMRWSLGRLVAMAAAGVVPVMSFVLERRIHRQALARIEG